MWFKRSPHFDAWIAAAGLIGLVVGFFSGQLLVIGAGAVGLCLVATRLSRRWWKSPPPPQETPAEAAPAPAPEAPAHPRPVRVVESEPQDRSTYVRQLLDQGRCCLLLRAQIVENLTATQHELAIEALHDAMALVPHGDVLVAQPDSDPEVEPLSHGQIITVEALYLDRYPVTNREFQQFLDAGGYEQSSLWDQEILPGILEFVDQSGNAGPRYWTDGTFPDGKADHPVVGVSWYEAAAYARWAGKRLPTDPEWVKAASWPVAVSGTRPQQRRYPWGDSFDSDRVNLWGTGPGDTVPVTAFEGGVSVGGVYQLAGNVWEWTTGYYGTWHSRERQVEADYPLRSLRGAAFDTYFDGHAACQFQSGDNPLARKHNIGFRCALGVCDLAPVQPTAAAPQDREPVEETDDSALEEVTS
jgi:iron(II)-dependent oxidoreductase